ncbi:hypothetical protein ABW21_db0208448 [Orbilia brochopaga]|nr:hypothetical protein ABW21_db0208448 [Drechslerella brochopaga]
MLLPLLKPKKVVLVSGTEDETSVFGDELRNMMEKDRRKKRGDSGKNDEEDEDKQVEVFTPAIGEMVNVSVEADAWSVKLSDALVKMLKWQHVRGLGVVHVVGRVIEVDENRNPKLENEEDVKMENDDATTIERKKRLVLDVLPPSAVSVRTAKPIHVGDVRLADLRKVLLDAGHTAELTGEGRLLCDGVVSVVKEGAGRVSIEDVGGGGGLLGGSLGRKERGRFWEVRRWVYEGLARISGV